MTFTVENLEFYLLVLVRVSALVMTAPFLVIILFGAGAGGHECVSFACDDSDDSVIDLNYAVL